MNSSSEVHPRAFAAYWEKTLDYDLENDFSDKMVFTNDFPVGDLPELNTLNKSSKIKMMEIGAQEGRTSLHLLEKYLLHKDSKIYCLDVWPDKKARFVMERNFDHNVKVWKKTTKHSLKDSQDISNKIIKIKGPSWKTLRRLNTEDDFESFDFIYIDGWHGAHGVIEDAVQCWKLLKVGGIMCFDDYAWRGGVRSFPRFKPEATPKLAIDSFAKIYKPFLKEIVCQNANRKSYQKVVSNKHECLSKNFK